MIATRPGLSAMAGVSAHGAPVIVTLAIVSARQGGISELDRESAEQLYLGRRATLPSGRAVTLVDLPAGPARDQFYLQLTRKNPSQIRAYWSRLVFTGRAQPQRHYQDDCHHAEPLHRSPFPYIVLRRPYQSELAPASPI